MVPHLRQLLVHLWVACSAGAVVIAGLAMGYVGLHTFVWAALAGLAVGVPAALLSWAHLRPNASRRLGWGWRIADWARGAG